MDDTTRISQETVLLKRGIEQLNAGDTSVRGELLNIACQRLMRLTSRLRQEFDGLSESKRSTQEVFENASVRLYQALHDTPIKDVRQFYRLAAIQIRRELIELCRHCQDLEPGSREASDGVERSSVEELRHWAQFHDSVDALPQPQREVFELIWYHEMDREQVAELLGVPLGQVRRLWRSARLSLHDYLGDGGFPADSAGK
jgi:RNA polymerase sigma-70 factor (ECF subfamily)